MVLDTCVVVSAFRSRRGASSRLLGLAANRRITALVTPALFLEYEEVLKRPEHRAVSGLSIAQIDGSLATLADVVEAVNVRNLPIPTMNLSWMPR